MEWCRGRVRLRPNRGVEWWSGGGVASVGPIEPSLAFRSLGYSELLLLLNS
jgi:hypothetical protein